MRRLPSLQLPPARIFMGDSGSHFLGAALAVISILGVAKVAVAFALAVPILALALPSRTPPGHRAETAGAHVGGEP